MEVPSDCQKRSLQAAFFGTMKKGDEDAAKRNTEFTASQAPPELEALVNDEYDLAFRAYQLAGSALCISNDTRRQIHTAISTVQTLLSIYPIGCRPDVKPRNPYTKADSSSGSP